jgi:uncharacterized membrane protein
MFIHVPIAHAPIARSRSLLKAITWRVVGSLDTLILSFVIPMVFGLNMGKSAKVALSIATIESVTKILLFYFHERMWARVPWGRADKVVEMAAAPVDEAEPAPVDSEAESGLKQVDEQAHSAPAARGGPDIQ